MNTFIAVVIACLAILLSARVQAFAVWPPSTAFEQQNSSVVYGLVVVALVVGILVGVWSQRNHHEHK